MEMGKKNGLNTDLLLRKPEKRGSIDRNFFFLHMIGYQQFVVVVQSLSRVWLHELQHTRLPCLSVSPGVCSTQVHCVVDTNQPSHPLSPPSPLVLNISQYQSLFQSVCSLHQVAKVLELQLQHQFIQWIFRVDFFLVLVWSSCCPRDSQELSPAPEFESINSLVLSLLYGPILIFLHDYWENHTFD